MNFNLIRPVFSFQKRPDYVDKLQGHSLSEFCVPIYSCCSSCYLFLKTHHLFRSNDPTYFLMHRFNQYEGSFMLFKESQSRRSTTQIVFHDRNAAK